MIRRPPRSTLFPSPTLSRSSGLPVFCIVGLPAMVVKESKERVRAALLNSHFEFPAGRITVSLAPADLPKEGGRFDLPIARSEEHTSELQSQSNLVCRLLLEK